MIKRIILRILANIGLLYILTDFIDVGFNITGDLRGYFIVAVTLGFINGIIKPILKLLSIPFVILTAGLFLIVINTLIVWFARYSLDILQFEGVRIIIEGGIGTYVSVGILVAAGNYFIGWLIKK